MIHLIQNMADKELKETVRSFATPEWLRAEAVDERILRLEAKHAAALEVVKAAKDRNSEKGGRPSHE